jgi:hypothetical protein
MATPITLKVFRGNELVRTEQFNREIIKIGRLASAHLVLDDEKVSRIHSVIEVAPDGAISIIDMGSAEGTFVNGKKVSRGALRLGDQITLGGLRIVVEGAENVAADPVNRAVAAAAPTPAAEKPAARPVRANGTNGTNGTNGANGHAKHSTTPANGHAALAVELPAPIAPAPAPAPAREKPAAGGGFKRAASPAAARPSFGRAARRRDDLTGAADLGVELRLLWGETLLEAATFVQPKAPVLAGEGPKAALHVTGLPSDEFPLLRWSGGEYQLAFAPGMTGTVEERGVRTPVGELVRARKAASDEAVKGAYWIPVPAAGAVRAELGGQLAIEAHPRRPDAVAAPPFWERLNYQLLNLFLILFFLQAAFVVTARDWRDDSESGGDALEKTMPRLAKYQIVAKKEEPKKPEKLAADAGKKDEEPGAPAEKARGDEGKMGKKDAPDTGKVSAVKRIIPNAKEQASKLGLLGALGRGGGGVGAAFGTGLGGDIRGATGNLMGSGEIGDSYGLGGLGLRGSGSGGGGTGETVGIGAVGTKGRGGGNAGYGTGAGNLGQKGDRGIVIPSTVSVQGSIDRDLVKKVIQEHRQQIQYCYEQALMLNPRLQGKVSIRWIINADGRAMTPEVDSATTLEDPKVHECMMSRITSADWVFPKPKGGGTAVITYPWIFRPAGGD